MSWFGSKSDQNQTFFPWSFQRTGRHQAPASPDAVGFPGSPFQLVAPGPRLGICGELRTCRQSFPCPGSHGRPHQHHLLWGNIPLAPGFLHTEAKSFYSAEEVQGKYAQEFGERLWKLSFFRQLQMTHSSKLNLWQGSCIVVKSRPVWVTLAGAFSNHHGKTRSLSWGNYHKDGQSVEGWRNWGTESSHDVSKA